MTDRYPFCSGARLDRAALEAAREATYSAAASLTTATVFDGVSDRSRDDALEAAELNLRDALFHVQALRQPEPPKVAPTVSTRGSDLFELACAIMAPPAGLGLPR